MIEGLEFFFGSKWIKLIKKIENLWGFLRRGKSVREKNDGGPVLRLSDGRR